MSSNLMKRGSQMICPGSMAFAAITRQTICEPRFIRLELILLPGIAGVPMRHGQPSSAEEVQITNTDQQLHL